MVALLDVGVSINDKNAAGQIALTLILLGADLLEQDPAGLTAVMHAVIRKDRLFIETLQQFWAVSYEQDSRIRREKLRGMPGIDRVLLQDREFDLVSFNAYHDSLEQADQDGETPPLKAAKAGDWGMFEKVGRTFDGLHASGKDGRTAAMHFAVAGTKEPFGELRKSHLFGRAGNQNGFVGVWLAFDADQLALADQAGKTALQLARDHRQEEIADTLLRHLETLVANQTDAIKRLEAGGLSAEEMSRELNLSLSSLEGDAETKRARLTDQLLRRHYETRSLAWQALGEKEKATQDYQTSRRRGA